MQKLTIPKLLEEKFQLPEEGKRVLILLDISGSTGGCFESNGFNNSYVTILEKEKKIADGLVINNPQNTYFLLPFDDRLEPLIERVSLDGFINPLDHLISRGGTSTLLPLQEALKRKSEFDEITIITDGQTSSDLSILKSVITSLKNEGLIIKIIAVTNSNVNMGTITSGDEFRLPGAELINACGNMIHLLEIYNNFHKDIPFKLAENSQSDNRRLCIMGVKVPLNRIFFLNDLIDHLVDNSERIDPGVNCFDSKQLCSEIGGKIFSVIFSDVSDNHSYLENVSLALSGINGFILLNPVEIAAGKTVQQKVKEFILYGYNCGRRKEPIRYANFDERVKDASVKKNEFQNATDLLTMNGPILDYGTVISFPFQGVCLTINR